MASEYETVRSRILSGEGSTSNRRPSLPTITPLTPINPPSSPSSAPSSPSTNSKTIPPQTFISALATHVKSLSDSRISQGFLHLHPSPIHSPPYLPSPSTNYTYLTDLFRRIDINLSTVSPLKLQSFLTTLLSRLIQSSTSLSHTGTDLPTTLKICHSIFTSTGITELNLPHTPQYDSELTTITLQNRPPTFSSVLKGREQVFNHTKALVHFLTTLISPNGELTQDLIKQTHRILVVDNDNIDSKPWDQYGGWYRDYRLLTEAEAAASTISSESIKSGMSPPSSSGGSRRSSSIYTLQPGDFRRSSSIYTFQQGDINRRYSSTSAPSSSASPTSPRRLSSLYYPITPITELCEDEELLPQQESPKLEFPERNRRESIDPRAVAMYMSKLISTYHAQLAMDRSQPRDLQQQQMDPDGEEEATISDPFALSAWLVTEFMHIHPFIVGNEEMSRIILTGVLMKELGIVAALGDEMDKEEGREEYLGILERCEERHREERHREEGQQGHGESYAEFAALVVKKAVDCVEEVAAMVGRS
ncbi:hypothetical protein TWF281_011646 [Arthrobotrys megalospora]